LAFFVLFGKSIPALLQIKVAGEQCILGLLKKAPIPKDRLREK